MRYVVKPGDTLFLIAKRFNTTVDELLRLNPQIKNPDSLQIGQVIRVSGRPGPGPGPGPKPGPRPRPKPTPDCPVLRQGSSGPAVVKLQTALRAAGFNPGAIDGVFGPRTHEAVVAFQRSRNLVPDGIVGPKTWAALGVCPPSPTPDPCPTLYPGNSGPAVRRLQRLLLRAGFNPGAIDGIYGERTRVAVLAFQRSRNLVQDGIVGRRTWTALGVRCS